jgi:NADH-quinone oxidoreductase subunit G
MADATKTSAPGVSAVKTVTLTIDGRSVTVPKGTTVLEAALRLGIAIPTFCWHPKLKPVGACRMCYVEIEKMAKLQVSCATEAMEGMIVRTNTDQVKRGRKAVIEFLLINHPLDCPTCDKGGECDLQNLTFAHGFDDSRFTYQKYRYTEAGVETTFDDYRIGPEIILNRNRCIRCFKCVRANKEAFGEYDLGAYERGNITEINAAPGEQVDSPFSGNLVEICPVGALTNTDWRYKIRVWLTKTVPSIGNLTPSGTNITFYTEEHKNRIYRVTSRTNDAVDDGWLADVTRYGYQFVQSPERLKTPLVKKGGKQSPASWDEALSIVARRLKEIQDTKGCVCIGGVASPHLDNASLYSFNKFMRVAVGTNGIDYRTDYKVLPQSPTTPYAVLASQPFKIADIDDSDVIVTFGGDLVKEHPNEYLRIRKAYNFRGPKIYSANSYSVKSADVANFEFIYNAGTEDAFVNGLCLAAIEEKLATVGDGELLKGKISPNSLTEASKLCGVASTDLKLLARALAEGKKITFIVGEQISQSKDRDVIAAALCNLERLLGLHNKGQIAALSHYANSTGGRRLGLLPEPVLEVKETLKSLWNEYPETSPLNTDEMFVQMKKEELDAFIILGANPIMLYPDRGFVEEALGKLDFLVVADLFETETTALADVVLPLASWAEYAGSYTNIEGRVQKASRAIRPLYESKPGSELIAMLAEKMETKLFESDAACDKEIERLFSLGGAVAWPAGWLEVKHAPEEIDPAYPHPLVIGDDPHHRGHWTEKSGSLVNFCGDAYIEMSEELAARYGIEEGKPVRVESAAGKVVVRATVSSLIENDVVFMPRNFSTARVTSLQMRKKRVDRVKITKAAD